ncbi:hypothetical protein CHY08_22895 (plasmid) [Rhizobium leguminosarum bv. viciae]|nr:hypothetical protein CHY08_22895 [Rhizobium leguminosarum bv. viciae]
MTGLTVSATQAARRPGLAVVPRQYVHRDIGIDEACLRIEHQTNNAIHEPSIGLASLAGHFAAPFFARMHPDDLSHVEREMRNVAASPDQTTIHFDYRILLPSGDVRHVTARGEVLRTSTGTVRTVGVLMDMTADRLPEAELAASVSNQKELLEQKDLLPAEVNHRVKNTLQLVVSTLHLQAWRLHFPVTVEAFEGAISRVRAIISVHERLYRSGNSLTVDMAGHLRKLCLDIVGETSAEKVTVEADALELPTERAIPVSIIVNELLSDVARHVFDRIYLSLKHKAEDLLELHVEINGRQSRPDELRIKIIATMAAQIGGTFEDGSATGGDYGATLTFPAREC